MKRIMAGMLVAALALIPLVSIAQTPVKTDQIISFDPISGLCASSSIEITASASSGLPVVFNSTNPSIAYVAGDSLVALAPGTVIITASQPGNEFYNPAPSVMQILTVSAIPEVFASDVTVCSGSETNIELYANTGGVNFTWEILDDGNISGGSSGSGSVISQVLHNNTLLADTIVYRITPVSNFCSGNPANLMVTVNPLPSVVAENKTICSGASTDIELSATLADANFQWTVESATNVPNATSGSGTSIAQTLINNTSSEGSVVYAITPVVAGCSGSPSSITVTVNPLPSVNAFSKTICSGQSTDLILASNIPMTAFSWQVEATENISGASASTGNLIDQILTNNTVTSGHAIYAVTPEANGCTGSTTNLTVTVNPVPVAIASDKTICSGQSAGVSLASDIPATTFSWTVHEVANVTGAFAGNGLAINQALTNSSTVTGSAVYAITPVANACTGQSVYATVTVKPAPIVLASGQTICSGATTDVTLTPNIPGTEFSWEVQSTLHVTGATSGSGPSIEQTLINNAASTGNAIYTITPAFDGCTGNAQNIIIVVNPTPQVILSDQVICSGQSTNIPLSSNIAGTSFMWTVQYTNNAIGASQGSGSVISQTLSTIFPAPGTVTYRVTPQFNGCTGVAQNAHVTVKPLASVIATNQTICSGETATINLSSDIEGTTFSWVVVSALNVTGATSGSGSVISNTLSLTSLLPSFVLYRVTASDGCGLGIVKDVIVTVESCPPDALNFNNDYVNIPHLLLNDRLNFGTGSFVLEAYVKATVSGGVRALLSKRTFAKGSASDGFLFGVWSDGRPFIQLGGAPNILPPVGAGNLYDGYCHHVALRRDGTRLSFFIDGVYVGDGNATSNRDVSTAGTLRIGADPATNSNFFGGWIGEIRLWNIALSDFQIAANLHTRMDPQPGLMGYYDMQDTGQVLTDLSTALNKNNGILGSSLLGDSFDPEWLMTQQITCSPGQNFKSGELPEEEVYMPDSLNLDEIASLIEIYPVPANESVTIGFTEKAFSGTILTLSDSYGATVATATFEGNEMSKVLDTAALPNGIYIVQLEILPGVVIRKKISVAHP